MTKREAIALCLSFADSYEDYPFDENWAAIRHTGNNKVFAFVFDYKGEERLNLKAAKEHIYDYRECFSAVVPAYHMNKNCWNSVILNGTVSEEALRFLIEESYDLTRPKTKNTGQKRAERKK